MATDPELWYLSQGIDSSNERKETMNRSSLVLLAVAGLGLGLMFGRGATRSDVDPSPRTIVTRPQVEVAQKDQAPADDGKLRIICFGAHPDDCELQVGGTAALWAGQGHHVKFVSVTNGDIGHWRDAGGPLARRRSAEVKQCARILGITSEVLDI